MDAEIPFLDPLVTAERWPFFRSLLRVLLAIALARFAWRLRAAPRISGAFPPSTPGAPLSLFRALFALALTAILAHQATWSLTGHLRPRFVEFMQRYDRRQFNPAHAIRRGAILDRHGQVLAHSQIGETTSRRAYPLGPAAAHLVGYANLRFGLTGLEAALNARLSHSAIENREDLARLSHQIFRGEIPELGDDLRVTLDADLQRLLYERLAPSRGAAVVIDPQNGNVLAMVSAPSFDPNQLDPTLFDTEPTDSPLLNRALHGLYPPGSTWKVALAAFALDTGPTPTLPCPAKGFRPEPGRPHIRDHEYYAAERAGRTWSGHGPLNLSEALVRSSNTYFAQLGVQLGAEALTTIADNGLVSTDIRLTQPHTASLTATASPHRWTRDAGPGAFAQVAIGQGDLLTTPLHMALLIASVANDGVAMRPRVVAMESPSAWRRVMKASSAARLREDLRRVVTEGTARGLNIPSLRAAGKTGSAENPHGKAHSWFIGFEPFDQPKYALAIVVENAGFGSQVAVPMAKEAFQHLKDSESPTSAP